MTARFFLFCYNLMQGSSISVTSFLRKKRLPVPPVHRQPPAEWGYLLDESAFLQQELNIGALDLFRSTLSISLSLKDSGAWLIGFLSMA